MARLGNWSAQRHGWGERNGGRRRQRGWRLQGPLLLARVFSECRVYRSIDLAPALFLGDVHHYGVIGIAGEGLRRPTPAAIEQRVCCRNAGVRGVAVSHFLEQALDRLSRMGSGKFPDLGHATRTAAGIAGSARGPSPVHKACCHLI